ncbi:MAG: sulfocyanin-like copper-binding protein, partial [Acidimicrobiales bacterium]
PRVAGAQGTRATPQAIDPAWLRADSATRTAQFELIAGLTGLNGALNFNGFRDGGLVLTVPLRWTVVMHFTNHDGDLPHSAEVTPDAKPLPVGPVPPAFERAYTIKLEQGLQAGQEDDIRFVADRAGDYLIFCAVPGHGAAGMWIRFRVSTTAARPGLATAQGGES